MQSVCGVINNERLQCCIVSDEDYEKVNIERIPVADLILAEVMSSVDLRKLIHIRKCSPNAKLLILSSIQISAGILYDSGNFTGYVVTKALYIF